MAKISEKPIKGYEDNYIITSNGRIYSIKSKKYLYLSLEKHGYYTVKLCKSGKMKNYLVHRLVAETFIPNPNNKTNVSHIDGNKRNNKVSNLEWSGTSEVCKKSYNKRSQHSLYPNALFTDEQASFIQELFSIGYSISKIARVFKTSQTTVSNIIKKKSYKGSFEMYHQNQHFSPQVINIIQSLLEHGYTYSQIATICNIDKQSVRDYYRNHFCVCR